MSRQHSYDNCVYVCWDGEGVGGYCFPQTVHHLTMETTLLCVCVCHIYHYIGLAELFVGRYKLPDYMYAGIETNTN